MHGSESNQNKLVFIFHGYALTPKRYASLKKAVEDVLPYAKVIVPKMPLSLFATISLKEVVNTQLQNIDEEWNLLSKEQKDNTKILLIGHSTGALIARKIYLSSYGENVDDPSESTVKSEKTKDWADKVDRIILLAGINKGWTINGHIPLAKLTLLNILIFIGACMSRLGYKPTAFESRRGSSFITELRLQSISMQKHALQKNLETALVIQLLGSIDDLVSPEDNLDLLIGNSYIYLDMPFSNHLSVINMTGKYGIQRSEIVRKALAHSKQQLAEEDIIPSDQDVITPDKSVTDVVFVLHGIRDEGFWTHKIARKVKLKGDGLQIESSTLKRKFAIETASYGYFPMLYFLSYMARRKKVEWLMNLYVENKILYPEASFSFIGHSNGTYLLAKALQKYEACKFKNVILAGSVVQRNYNWQTLLNNQRIEHICNIIANKDWVVGIFPKTFQTLSWQDIGSGGYDGFSNLSENFQIKYFEGGHGGAIQEPYWDELAHFVVYGNFKHPSIFQSTSNRPLCVKLLANLGPLIFLFMIASIIFISFFIWKLPIDRMGAIGLLFAFWFVVYKGLTWY